jgi:predicted chitinase/LysM repeat protein
MAEISTEIKDYLRGTAIDDAMREALEIPEVYQGAQSEEEPDPIVDTDVLKEALQPEPITVEELPDVIVKAGDTLTAIAEANNLPVQDVIDANPQIANPDMIRPGQKINMPSRPLTAEERTALSYRGPSWQKSQGLPIYKDGSFDKPTMEGSLEEAGLVGKEAALLKGAVKTEVGDDGARTEDPYSLSNLEGFTGAWKQRSIDAGLLDPSGNATPLARQLNSQGALGDTIFDVQYAGRNGNGDIASGDGSTFKGRGLVQITGRRNYQAVQDRLAETGLNIDLMANPELVNDERYALPATLAMMDILGVNSSSADTMSAKTLNNAINSGAAAGTAQERWENVLNAASPGERAELELRDEYAAQIEVGLTGTDVDGDIGVGTKRRIDEWAASKGLTPPAVTQITKISNRTGRSYPTYSPEDKLKLAIFVNENS